MLSQQYARTVPNTAAAPAIRLKLVPDLSRVFELNGSNLSEALEFLAVRPVHTVVMTSFIHDNGFDRDLNRGRFYGYRNPDGTLEGVALIGHSTLFEARSEDAVEALAFVARSSETPIHLIMSSGDAADRFWNAFSGGSSEPRLRCEERLFEAAFPFAVQTSERKIGNADESQLLQVAEAQAEIAFIECGVDPMVKDREGFLKRVLRRIEQGRVFTVFENDKLVFKADIIAETDDVIYLEGVYVGEEYRGQGIGPKCLSALTAKLLGRVSNICLLSNVDFEHAHRSFEKAGYRATDKCVTLFV
jgi:GNAT superfamily N-acetyltransferase